MMASGRSLAIAAKAVSNSSSLLILIGLIAVPVASPPSWICSRKGLEGIDRVGQSGDPARRRQHVADQLDALSGQFGGYARDAGDISTPSGEGHDPARAHRISGLG